jgi:hypothetical protein
MEVRGALRGVMEPGERLMGWALVLPTGRAAVAGSAFAMGVIVPVLMPLSVLTAAWSQAAGRRLAVLTDRRLVMLDAARGRPRVAGAFPLEQVDTRVPGDPDRAVRVRAGGVWYHAIMNGLERRFVQATRVLDAARADAGSPDAVC